MTGVTAFASREEMADPAADVVAEALSVPDARTFVATGGTTVGPVYDRLARRALAWDRLTVTLTDDRWVDESSDLSNEGLVRRRLLVGAAARAAFLPLKGGGDSLQADARAADAGLRHLLPSAAVLLGMGADGHVASLFPGDAEGIDPDDPRLCIAVAQAGLAPFVPRLSLTVRALLASRLVVIVVTGDEKRAVIDRIMRDSQFAPPAAVLLRQTATPVRLFWAS